MNLSELTGALPDVGELRQRSRALAMCDAILSPDWEDRYYSFDSGWNPGEEMASMRTGSGDEYSIVFSAAGAYIRGLDHERRQPPGLTGDVPPVFAAHVSDPAFSAGANVCLWRQTGDPAWQGRGLDEATWLFDLLVDGTPAAYQEFAEDYYGEDVDQAAVAEIFALRPLTADLVRRLNPELTLDDLAEDIAEIAYPPR